MRSITRSILTGLLIGNLACPAAALAEMLPARSPSILTEEEMAFQPAQRSKKEVSELELSIEKARFIRYRQDRWNEMRRRLESGEALIPEAEKPVPTAERKALPAPPPLGPGLNVVLPYESGLSISGRKAIDFKLSSTIYRQPDSGKGRVNKSDFTLEQQLQVRVKGTVGRKVTVNVDFDDTRGDDQRDISVTYKGDPDEVLQEAAFGDISISLPSTEFVGYSKSVFGVRAQLLFRPRSGFARYFPSALWHRYTPKQIRLYLIGSRTKGITKTKRFTGNSVLQRKEIDDIAYPRRQFYQLAFATGPAPGKLEHRPIVVGSEKIFVDDQNPNNNNIDESTRTFAIHEPTLTSVGGVDPSTRVFQGPAGENTGVFKLLVPGVDYTVDYVKGTIRFRRAIQITDIVAADYIPVGSNQPISQTLAGDDPRVPPDKKSTDLLKGFKPFLLKPDESQFFATREVKSIYNLGDTNIVRDDGRGNFILKIVDLNRNEPSILEGLDISTAPQTKPVPKYPQNIDVDFETGLVTFISSDTFRTPDPRPFTDDIYIFRDQVPSFKNRYRIFAEYSFRKGNFNLDQANIVSLSEQVFVDGRKMTRDVDYFIDYDVGLVTFFRPDQIRSDSVVEITYDFSPFGGQGEETLVGLRSEWQVTDHFFFGNSFLFNFAPRTQGVPDLRSTARSIMVLEGDLNITDLKFGRFPIEIKTISAEIARSIKNPNTAGKAMIESFEGVKLEDQAGLNKDSWQVAANPSQGNPISAGGAFDPGYAATQQGGRGVFLSNEDFKVTDIIPSAAVEPSEQIQALKLDYNLPGQYEAASVVQTFSRSGVDFFTNRRQFLELWIHGDNSQAEMRFRLGGTAERSDSDPSGTLKTEDLDRNSALSPGEDVGWSFLNPDASTATVGAGNGRLDTQDLDGNGRLDSDDTLGNYSNEIGGAGNPLREANGVTHANVDWDGWKVFQVPLNITTTGQAEWSAVKQIRVSVVNPSALAKSGTLRLGRVSVVGTRIADAQVDPSTAPISGRAFAANNQENADYPSLLTPPDFLNLHEIEEDNPKRREQALRIEYQRTAAVEIATVTTKRTFSPAQDFSEHETFRFFLHGDNSGSRFFLRLGNADNYLEYQTNITFGGWRLIELDILDKNRDGKLDRNAPKPFGKWTGQKGSPSLRNVAEITMGLVAVNGGPDSEAKYVYVNDIHLTDSVKIVGNAWRARGDFAWANWGSWGGSWRFVDRNFQTLTSVGSGVDSKNGSGYLNLSRMKFLPLNSSFGYSETITPQIQTVDDPNVLVSVINEGKVISTNQNLSGTFFMTQLPLLPNSVKNKLLNIDGSVDHSLTTRSDAERRDEAFNYRYGTSYTFPWRPDVLPTRFFKFHPLPTSLAYSFSRGKSITELKADNSRTESFTDNYSLRTAFQFFPQFSLTPSYSLSQSFEDKSLLVDNFAVTPATAPLRDQLGKVNKTLNQSLSFSGSLRVLSWFAPGYSYSITTSETHNVNEVVFGTNTFRRGALKNITRGSNGDVSASLSPKDVFQYIPYVRGINRAINTMNFSGGYSISDGDSYENIDGGFDSRDKLVIRGKTFNLEGMNPNARRTSLTATDTSRLSGRWQPFEGLAFLRSRLWAPLKNINGSGTFTETVTKRDTTGTQSVSYSRVWPDFIFSTSEIERPLFLSRWMQDTRLNGNYQKRVTETLGQTKSLANSLGSDFTFTLFRLLQFSLSYTNSVQEDFNLQTNQLTNRTRSRGINGQVITTLKVGNWRFTPHYDQSQSESEDGTGKKTSDVVNRNGSLQVFGDVNIPRFFRLPFGKQLALSNRLILTGSFRYGIIRDNVDETKSNDTFDSNVNGDFEITPNIRAAFGGGYMRVMNKARKEDDFTTISVTSRVTIQF
ncbi:MAG: hypothetical protein A2636_01510 [Elusimicrobia bacterium RIFCSPHIGHO2_01_FULL_64_10]|nr:MAG: hypothetical protein A2636_01510 [Elusimicrobia bacterium RIFCSPHIGHO2_01_FULL_64_10]